MIAGAATTVAALLGAWFVVALAVFVSCSCRGVIVASVGRALARQGLEGLGTDRVRNVRRVGIDRVTRLDVVSRAMLASEGIAVGESDFQIRGLCGSILRTPDGDVLVRGGVPQFVRAITLVRLGEKLANVLTLSASVVAIISVVAALAGYGARPIAGMLLALIAVLAITVRDLESPRHFTPVHMTRAQRHVQRRFEAMFRGI